MFSYAMYYDLQVIWRTHVEKFPSNCCHLYHNKWAKALRVAMNRWFREQNIELFNMLASVLYSVMKLAIL